MRIISGKNRGRHIVAPTNLPVRPTMDMGKESLFNILNNYFYLDSVRVLDLFSGTGNITYEFASRGAISVVAVDENLLCTKFIQKTIDQLQYNDQVEEDQQGRSHQITPQGGQDTLRYAQEVIKALKHSP